MERSFSVKREIPSKFMLLKHSKRSILSKRTRLNILLLRDLFWYEAQYIKYFIGKHSASLYHRIGLCVSKQN
jgi:hypothetical protein